MVYAYERHSRCHSRISHCPADKFALLFKRRLESLFVERIDQNEQLFARYMNDRDFQKVVSEWLGSEVYQRLSKGEG